MSAVPGASERLPEMWEASQIAAGLEVEVIQLEEPLSLHGGEALGAFVEIRRGNDDGLQDLAA